MSDILLKLRNITKSYDNNFYVLNNLNLEVNRGDYISIMGDSGSGKSTLLNIIGLLDDYDKGDYYIEGNKVLDYSEKTLSIIRNSIIGFIFQSYNLISNLTVYENILIPYLYDKEHIIDYKVLNNNIERYMELLGITKLKNKNVDDLSGGEKQRVGIARVLSKEPKIIIADEPTGNLDEKNTRKIYNFLNELNSKHGYTILVVTHDIKYARMAKIKLKLVGGRLYEEK